MWLDKFRRVTSSSFYLPQIDGLRFLAIFLVVVQMHVPHYIDKEFFGSALIQGKYWRSWIMEGTNGVVLFFIISGFILGLPFARAFIKNGNKVDLKHYYIRRFTRLEPPYLIVLCTLFLAHIFILHQYSFTQLWPHFLASVFYQHNLIYERFPLVMPVAWTLEIEVQFYILAPLFCCLFLIRSRVVRLLVYSIIILLTFYLGSLELLGFRNVLSALYFFVAGLALADLYVDDLQLFENEKIGAWVGVIALLCFLFMIPQYKGIYFFVKYLLLVLVVHITLTNPGFKKLFSAKWMTLIGGMCYSLYLTHFAVISAVGMVFKKVGLGEATFTFAVLSFAVFLIAILLVTAAFFYFIEKPYMLYNIRRRKC